MSERFEEQIFDKKGPGIVGKVDHFPETISAEEPDFSFAERIIKGSDRVSKEDLLSAFRMMENKINFPLSAEEEEILGKDEEKINTINMLVNDYLEAIKTLDTKKQGVLRESLKQLFSEVEEG